MRRLATQARPFRWQLGVMTLLSLVATPLTLLTPVPLAIAVDSAVGSKPLPGFVETVVPSWARSSQFRVLVLAAVLEIVVVLLLQLQNLALYVLQTTTGEQMTLRFQSRLFAHAQRLSFAFHDARGTVDSIYRIQYDAPSIQYILVFGILPFLSAGFTLVSMVVVIFGIDPLLGFVALGISPLLFWYSRSYSVKMRPHYKEAKRLQSVAFGVVQEVLTGFRVVKAYGREEHEEHRFVNRGSAGVHAQVRLAFAEGTFELLVNLTTAVGTAAVLFIGVLNVRAHELTVGQLVLVIGYLAMLYGPLQVLSKQVASLQNQFAGAERAFELLDEIPEVAELPNARPLRRARGELEFRDVSFDYGSERVLTRVSLTLPAGTRLGIAGQTGAGKTTLISLVSRFYDPTEGSILLDGVDLREYRLADLRNQFAIMLQEPVLFSTTIADNIAYARPDATFDDVVAAAKAAGAHEFVSRLVEGYDTTVGERGMRLSGGERQRIALARAFLKDAPVLLMDEPTSSVDVDTERVIMEAMHRLMTGRTTLMIAHRLSTLDGCDQRLELDHGRVLSVSGSARDTANSRFGRREVDRLRVASGHIGAPDEHPAGAAWHRLGVGRRPSGIDVLTAPTGRRVWKSRVYRLRGAAPDGGNVVVKQASAETILVERRVYEEVLPTISLETIGCYGSIDDPEAAWLFLEEARGEPYADGHAEHRRLATDWLAQLHRRTATLALEQRFPDRGPSWYLERLVEGRRTIEENLSNPALREPAQEVLRDVVTRIDGLAASWRDIEVLARSLTPTLVHGDFTSKNVLVSAGEDRRRLSVMDWDVAGWGIPASDLAAVDVARYHLMCERSDGMSPTSLRAVAHLGAVFRCILWIQATSRALTTEWVERPVRKLEQYASGLSGALTELEKSWTTDARLTG